MQVRQPALLALAAVFVLCLLVVGLQRTTSDGPAPSDAEADGATGQTAPMVDASEALTSSSDWQVTPGPAAAPRTSAPAAPSAPPVQVRIDALDLREDLIDLGIARDGTMQVPRDPDRVGWFTGGGRPGGAGPTVLIGHVDSVDGPAVFAGLSELEVGDEVVVRTAEGRHAYRVSDTRSVPQDDFPTAQVFGATGTDVLRLITCSGPYDREVGRYTENRVVTAVPA